MVKEFWVLMMLIAKNGLDMVFGDIQYLISLGFITIAYLMLEKLKLNF